MIEFDQRQMVEAHQSGDEEAFVAIVRSARPKLYSVARRRLRSHEAAEDAVQETFVRAFRALPNFDGEFRLHAWLHRILANVCTDEGMRRARESGMVSRVGALAEEEAPDPAEGITRAATRASVTDALSQLPASYRAAVALRYVDDLPYCEVAEAMGVTEQNARARVSRGRAVLQRLLSPGLGLLALVVPGWRRFSRVAVDAGPSGGLASPGLAEHVSQVAVTSGAGSPLSAFSTQVIGSVVQAAPTVTRLAEVASTGAGASRSSMFANVVGAVAAVIVPVTAAGMADAPPRAPRAEVQVVGAVPPWSERPVSNGGRSGISTATSTSAGALATPGSSSGPSLQTPGSAVARAGGADLGTTVPGALPLPVVLLPDPPIEWTLPEIHAEGAAQELPAGPAPSGSDDVGVSPETPLSRALFVSDDISVTQDGFRLGLQGDLRLASENIADPANAFLGAFQGYLRLSDPTGAGRRRASGELKISIAHETYSLRLDGEVAEQRTGDGGTSFDFVGVYRLGGASYLGFFGRGEAAWTLVVPSDSGETADTPLEQPANHGATSHSDGSTSAQPAQAIRPSLRMVLGDGPADVGQR